MMRICVCHAYADVRHMDMLCISLSLSFHGQIRKKLVPDLLSSLRGAAAQKHKMCHPISCFFANMLCYPLPRDWPLSTVIERFAYSLTVVHFRKPLNNEKVGSP